MKDLPDLTELSIIELLHDIKNESVLIRKGATGTVLVSPDGFPDSGDVSFDLNDKTDYEIIGEEPEDPYPMFSLERNTDFKVIQYFDEKELYNHSNLFYHMYLYQILLLILFLQSH